MISSPTIVDMFPHQTFAWLGTFCKLLDGLFLCPEWHLWQIETTSVKNCLLTSHYVFRFSHLTNGKTYMNSILMSQSFSYSCCVQYSFHGLFDEFFLELRA